MKLRHLMQKLNDINSIDPAALDQDCITYDTYSNEFSELVDIDITDDSFASVESDRLVLIL